MTQNHLCLAVLTLAAALTSQLFAQVQTEVPPAVVDQYISSLRQYRGIALDVGDQDGLRVDTVKLHEVLDKYGIANSFEQYQGTHKIRLNHKPSKVALGQEVLEVQVKQIQIGFDDDAIRYLVNALPPDMIH